MDSVYGRTTKRKNSGPRIILLHAPFQMPKKKDMNMYPIMMADGDYSWKVRFGRGQFFPLVVAEMGRGHVGQVVC